MAFAFMEHEQPAKGKYADSIVGTFRSGHAIKGRPVALTEWRVSTDDVDVAEAIAENFGGAYQEWDSEKEPFEVFTEASSVDIIIQAGSLRYNMQLWGRNALLRSCNGVTQTGENEGRPCECPAALQDRKDAAKTGRGCSPAVSVVFSLASMPDLGLFRFRTGSWTFLKDLESLEKALDKIDGDAKATLKLEEVSYTSKTGKAVSFTKPVITVKGKHESS